MTVTPSTGSGVAAYNPDEDYATGLEDVGVGDVVLPRLSIVHDGARFRDNLTKDEFDELEVIVLGLVKQRVMFHPVVEDNDKPMCKSPDFEFGFPNNSEETKKDKRFPWAKSNFNPDDFAPDPEFNNLITLPCNSCIFSQWDKGDWKQPPCAEQHTYPLLYNTTPGTDQQNWQPALLSVQKTGIRPSRQFISTFAQSKTAMFTVITRLTLTQQSRGTVKYSVPGFRKIGESDRDMWGEYAGQLRQIREYIRQPPRNDLDEEESAPSGFNNENTAPVQSTVATPAAPAAAPATAPPTAPAAPAAPPQAEAPVTPAEPTVAPTPAPAPPDDDGLPF